MDILDYIHSKGLFLHDIRSSNIAIGNSRETMNKIFIFDLASSAEISEKFTPKDDLLLLGLVLLELNGVEFAEIGGLTDIKSIIALLLEKWDEKYVNVSIKFFFHSHLRLVKTKQKAEIVTVNVFLLGTLRKFRSA